MSTTSRRETTSVSTAREASSAGNGISEGTTAAEGDPVAIARDIVEDTQLLFVKHIELAKIEIADAVEARIKAMVAAGVAAVIGLFALGFLASAVAYGLDNVMAPWLSRLVVGGAFLLITAGAALYGRSRMLSPPFAPEQTKQMIEEDRQWARTRLRR